MPSFVVTFRIHQDSGYTVRYQSLVDEIYRLAGGSGSTSDETTSFIALKIGGYTAASLCDHLYLHTKIMVPNDKILVIDVTNRQKKQRGFSYETVLDHVLGF